MDLLIANPTMGLLAGAIVVLLLPESLCMRAEVIWALRCFLRRNLWNLAQLSMQSPAFKLLGPCAQRCRCRSLVSHSLPLPPHAVRARAVSSTEVVLCWIARPQRGGLLCADPVYVYGWRCTRGQGTASEVSEELAAWHEGPMPDTERGRDDAERELFSAPCKGLPEGMRLRLRICGQNRHGRGDWSEEIEIEMPAWQEVAGARGRVPQALACSRVVVQDERLCVQCHRMQPSTSAVAYANVECPSMFMRECPHGPFCVRCRKAVSAQVLPSCICRALIGTWRDTRQTCEAAN